MGNLVLGDCEEFRKLLSGKGQNQLEERRVLGLTIIRGEEVISIVIEGPPPADIVRSKPQFAPAGLGFGCSTGRGFTFQSPQMPDGLVGVSKGLVGTFLNTMNPRPKISPPSQSYFGARPLPGVSLSTPACQFPTALPATSQLSQPPL